MRVAPSCILDGLLPLLMIVVASGTFTDVASNNCGVDFNGVREYADSSCSSAAISSED
jgi:hypothetical protein